MRELKSDRILSLDVFRGITVAAMILVNNPGDWGNIFAPLKHAEWNGCTPTDLIFPFFLFIVGVSIVYAFDSKIQLKESHPALIKAILIRSLKLFSLGLILALFPYFDFLTVRIPGVLQRIAVVYLVCSLMFLKLKPKTISIIFFSILIFYAFLMLIVPVPGIGYPNLERETNLGAWLDRLIFTETHLWKQAKTWDPEGFLTTLPSIASGLFGVSMGIILKNKNRNELERIINLYTFGFFGIILGLIVDLFFPMNKSLWTSSFVLYTGGIATVFLACCYWIIDVKANHRFTKPFVVYGVNAITVFFASGIIGRSMSLIKTDLNGTSVSIKEFLYQQYFTPYLSPNLASVAYALAFVCIWWIILAIMHKKNIVIKV